MKEKKEEVKRRMNREMKKDPRSITYDTLVNIYKIETHKKTR